MRRVSLLVTLLCIVAAVVIIVLGVTGRFRAQEPVTPERVTVAVNTATDAAPCVEEPLAVEVDHIDVIKARHQVRIAPLPDEPEHAAATASQAVPQAVSQDTDPAVVLAQMVYGEGRNQPKMHMAAIVWCVLNRVDAGYGDIISVVTAPGQFVGYSASNPVEEHILAIVNDVLERWNNGGEGRVLPSDYLWFSAGNGENLFRNAFTNGTIWDWSLPNPYAEGAE